MMQLQQCNWGFILLSMAAGAMAFWIRGLRWRRLLLPLDQSISRTTTFNGINIGNISNFVFPRIGEFVRCGVIVRRSQPDEPSEPLKKKASYEKVLGTVVVERSWELLVMLLTLMVLQAMKLLEMLLLFLKLKKQLQNIRSSSFLDLSISILRRLRRIYVPLTIITISTSPRYITMSFHLILRIRKRFYLAFLNSQNSNLRLFLSGYRQVCRVHLRFFHEDGGW